MSSQVSPQSVTNSWVLISQFVTMVRPLGLGCWVAMCIRSHPSANGKNWDYGRSYQDVLAMTHQKSRLRQLC
jgi:hypothetical protein